MGDHQLPDVLSGGPVQIAYAVQDIRIAATSWMAAGAGPFFLRDHIEVADVLVDGQPGIFDHSSAYGQWGALMVELVCVHEPSTLGATGLHHMAWFVESFDEATGALSAAGFAQRLSATAGTTRFAFHDGGDVLDHAIEIYEGNEALRRFYGFVRDAAADWDGSDPLRSLG